ncbi:MAG: glycine--tRNA ligase subunit beta, partial [Rhizobacter sp.]|nr:glycine--tRNA ligase subunit beta [Rhizobacter sp.]
PAGVFSADVLVEPAEKDLYAAMDRVGALARGHFERGDYERALSELAALRSAVDGFFDTVMVNAEDLALRNNRLWLLKDLHTDMNRVADLSKLAA